MIPQVKTVEPLDPYQRLNDPIPIPVQPSEALSGPAPMFNLPAVRKQRQFVVLATIAVTIGVLIFALKNQRRNDFLSPGSLANVHEQVLREQGTERCAACHGADPGNLGQLIQDAFTGGQVFDMSQSHLCLVCHSHSLNVDHALNPHGADLGNLNDITSAKRMALAHSNQVMPSIHPNETACASCHREHQGKLVDLTAISNAKCQTCHVQAYDRFEGSHPDFQLASHPVADRNLAFDHRSHALKHFVEKGQGFECRACHVTDGTRNDFGLTSFSVACAACHETSLRESLAGGISLIQLPTLDVQALSRAGHSVPEWPANLQGDFDGSLSPMMALLLFGDPVVRTILVEQQDLFDFFYVDPQDERGLQRATDYAAAIIRLKAEVIQSGRLALKKRLVAATGMEISDAELDRLFGGLTDQQLQQLVHQRQARLDSLSKFAGETKLIVKPENLALSIRPDELLAINPITGKLGTGSARRNGQIQTINQPNKEQYELHRSESPPPGSGADTQRQGEDVSRLPPPNPQGELLTPNPLSSVFVNSEKQSTASGLTYNLDGTHVHDVPPKRPRVSEPKYPPEVKPFAVDRFQLKSRRDVISPSVGQWFVNSSPSEFLKYIPQAHADVVAQAWYELAHRAGTSPNHQPAVSDLLKKVIVSGGIGSCSQCHQARPSSSLGEFHSQAQPSAIQWRFEPAITFKSSFNRFSHGPHLLLKDCTDCHQLAQQPRIAVTASLVGDSVSTALDSDFRPQTKLDCATCHTKGHAPNECSHCHRYHVGVPKHPLPSESPIGVSLKR